MSKRHQSSRRRSYGRRQHEIHERTVRRAPRDDVAFDVATWAQPEGRFGEVELDLGFGSGLRFAATD
jgi:hypothetical protein